MHKIDITQSQQSVLDPYAVVCLVLGAGHLEGVGNGLVAVYRQKHGELLGFLPVYPNGSLVEVRVDDRKKKHPVIYLAFQELIPAMVQ